MLSFHGDPLIKAKYLARVRAHAAADRLVQGLGWDGVNLKGCAIGCTLEAYDHSLYPIELGLPVWLAKLEDMLFEHLSKVSARSWPEKFLESIPVGVDVDKVRFGMSIRRMDRLISMHEKLAVSDYPAHTTGAINGTVNMLRVARAYCEAELGTGGCDLSDRWATVAMAATATVISSDRATAGLVMAGGQTAKAAVMRSVCRAAEAVVEVVDSALSRDGDGDGEAESGRCAAEAAAAVGIVADAGASPLCQERAELAELKNWWNAEAGDLLELLAATA